MSDYRIGDKVKIRAGGSVGTVIRVSDRLKHPILVEFPSGPDRGFAVDELEKVTPSAGMTPALKVK